MCDLFLNYFSCAFIGLNKAYKDSQTEDTFLLCLSNSVAPHSEVSHVKK